MCLMTLFETLPRGQAQQSLNGLALASVLVPGRATWLDMGPIAVGYNNPSDQQQFLIV